DYGPPRTAAGDPGPPNLEPNNPGVAPRHRCGATAGHQTRHQGTFPLSHQSEGVEGRDPGGAGGAVPARDVRGRAGRGDGPGVCPRQRFATVCLLRLLQRRPGPGPDGRPATAPTSAGVRTGQHLCGDRGRPPGGNPVAAAAHGHQRLWPGRAGVQARPARRHLQAARLQRPHLGVPFIGRAGRRRLPILAVRRSDGTVTRPVSRPRGRALDPPADRLADGPDGPGKRSPRLAALPDLPPHRAYRRRLQQGRSPTGAGGVRAAAVSGRATRLLRVTALGRNGGAAGTLGPTCHIATARMQGTIQEVVRHGAQSARPPRVATPRVGHRGTIRQLGEALLDHYRTARVLGLDLLRILAAFPIVLFHGNVIGAFGRNPFSTAVTADGYLAVDVFFVLSGWLLTRQALRMRSPFKSATRFVTRFWTRRWARTLPPYWVVLLAIFLFRPWLDPKTFWHPWSLAVLLKHAFFLQTLLPPNAYGVTWSLVTEEWFYLVLPFAVLLAARVRSRRLLVGLGLALLLP